MTPHSLLAPARLAGLRLLTSQTDQRLLDLASAGSDPAFEAIVTRYRGPLLRYCSGFLPEGRAEDAVQQTFLKAHAALARGEAVRSLRAWLYRIAHNTALNDLRDRALRNEPLAETIDGVERPDEVAERRSDLREVLQAVQGLPERQRDAILLRTIEGRSYDEIAAALGVSDGAVRQLLNRARNTVRAAATAVTPLELLLRVPMATDAPAAAGAAAKVCAAALATGAVIGGGAAVPSPDAERAPRAAAPEARLKVAARPKRRAAPSPSRSASAPVRASARSSPASKAAATPVTERSSARAQARVERDEPAGDFDPPQRERREQRSERDWQQAPREHEAYGGNHAARDGGMGGYGEAAGHDVHAERQREPGGQGRAAGPPPPSQAPAAQPQPAA